MTSGELLANRLQEVYLSGTWIANTNYQHALQDVPLAKATYTVASLNTIAALTYHINYYLEGLLQVLQGGELLIKDQYSFALPPLHAEHEWLLLKNRLFNNATAFAQAVARLTDEQLEAAFVRPEYGTYRRNIEAVIEHSYYHLGQISLLLKLQAANS